MDRYQCVSTIEQVYKVYDLDSAVREVKRTIKSPWNLVKKQLKIFKDIYLYNPEDDFERLAFLDDKLEYKLNKPQFQYTSYKQFVEDPNNENTLAEIFTNGERKIGVNYKTIELNQVVVDDCSDSSRYLASGDFTNASLNYAKTYKNEYSIKFACTKVSDIANIDIQFDDIYVEKYRKYFMFSYIYLNAIPTSIDMAIFNGTNELSKNITKQFDGSDFKLNDWNIIAFDLNDCIEVGDTAGTFNSAKIVLNGVATGNYYLGGIDLKQWRELDYNYYSKNGIVSSTGVYKYQFINTLDNSFDLDDELIGEDIYSDVVLYEALCLAINEKENSAIFNLVKEKRELAYMALFENYPDLAPQIVEVRYNYVTN